MVETELQAAGWTVTSDAYDAPAFSDDGASSLEVGGRTFAIGDLRPLIFAPPGDVDGPVVAIDQEPGSADRTGKGCAVTHYGDLPPKAIVVVRSGDCLRRDQVIAAQHAGAAAFIAVYPGAPEGTVYRPTLIEPTFMEIPAAAVSPEAAAALVTAAAAGGTARLRTTAETRSAPTRSVLAELPGTRPESVIMLGAHLDSVVDGPGINDDGSGVAALLELARALGGTRPRATIRLAFWSGEELGPPRLVPLRHGALHGGRAGHPRLRERRHDRVAQRVRRRLRRVGRPGGLHGRAGSPDRRGEARGRHPPSASTSAADPTTTPSPRPASPRPGSSRGPRSR